MRFAQLGPPTKPFPGKKPGQRRVLERPNNEYDDASGPSKRNSPALWLELSGLHCPKVRLFLTQLRETDELTIGGHYNNLPASQMGHPEYLERFEKARSSANPEQELYHLAVSLRDEGVSQVDLYLLFERFCQLNHRERPKPDAILDTMDMIYGGRCARGRALYHRELEEKAINEYRHTA